ncbi:MAG: tyrosine-type recombinase/integrase [Chromatiaceae bacterium]|nr:tyrosine-type recombinase/integrase [Chromatiaceae bacterium]
MPIVRLTQDLIDNDQLTCPADKRRIEYCDGNHKLAVPGLYLEARQSGQTFYLRYKNANGKSSHAKIGRITDIDLATARDKAKELRARIALGADPSVEKKAANAALTFADFFSDHYLPFAKQRKRTWKRDQELFNRHLKPQFGHRKLNQITRAQIQTFHTGLRNQGLAGATCDHQVKLLRRCLNLAVEWGLLQSNPATGFKLFNDDNRIEHYLDDDQLQRLLRVLRTDTNRVVCNVALWLLSTGARLNEALQARWDMVDRDNRVWRIPSATSKSKKPRSVPLNDAALAVLDALDTKDKFDHLFINRKTKKPYTTIHKVWERIRHEARLPDLRIHDLRHSYASFLVNAGRSLYEVQQILGHSQPQVTQRYSHLSTRTLRDAADTASVAITRASKTATD